MLEIYVDADACPVKGEILRVAGRHGLKTWMVSDGGVRPSASPLVELVIVPSGMDAADDWIAARIGAGDIALTADTPLAARCIAKGARVLRFNGRPFDAQSIGPIGNSIVGSIGGGVGGQILQALIPALTGDAAGGLDAGAVVGNLVGGGVAGAVLTGIVGLIKYKMAA